MIELDGVSKIYRTAAGEVRALDDVSLGVDEGEFVAVRGPSGCGKSTLLALIGALAQPTSGRVAIAGTDLTRLSPTQRAKFRADTIGFVFQMFHLLPYLDVFDNVVVAAPAERRQQARQHAEELLVEFGLAERRTHKPTELSAGERQRVAMARALLNQPRVLLADEPTGNLDPENAKALLDLLARIHRDGATILLVTHEEYAADYASRTISLREGRLETEVAAGEDVS